MLRLRWGNLGRQPKSKLECWVDGRRLSSSAECLYDNDCANDDDGDDDNDDDGDDDDNDDVDGDGGELRAAAIVDVDGDGGELIEPPLLLMLMAIMVASL